MSRRRRHVIVCLACGKSFETVLSHKAKYCSRTCRDTHSVGENHPGFGKGRNRSVTAQGYVIVRKKGAHLMPSSEQKYEVEHRLIAEQVLGRPLTSNECVHHINGDKTDNRHENLLICDKSYHRWLHSRMSYLYQREHFGR